MEPRKFAFLAYYHVLSILLLLVGTVHAAQPSHSVTRFKWFPLTLSFFDDTPVAIYHDQAFGNVYVLQSKGKSWDRASDIPEGEAHSFIKHPFDNNYAFALSQGRTHWRTADRGKTWHSFEVPMEPAMTAAPLSFHVDKKNYGYILYRGTGCRSFPQWGQKCSDTTYYTKDAFSSKAEILLENNSRCQFAHSSPDFKHDAHENLIYCVASSPGPADHWRELSARRLYSSTDFFDKEIKIEDLGIGEEKSGGVVSLTIVSQSAVVGLKDVESDTDDGEISLYVSVDTTTWSKAQFPHVSYAKLYEDRYTFVESTKHTLAVSVGMQDYTPISTLFVSDSSGRYFVESLKDMTTDYEGNLEYEKVYGVEGVSLANVVANAEEIRRKDDRDFVRKRLKSVITFDDGSSWRPIKPPLKSASGEPWFCDISDSESCSLHFLDTTTSYNSGRVFSSPAPGYVMAVGSVGPHLARASECQTFLSTDAGVSWRAIDSQTSVHGFADSGEIIVLVNNQEKTVDEVKYSLDQGRSFDSYPLPNRMDATLHLSMVAVPNASGFGSVEIMLVGREADWRKGGGFDLVTIHLDLSSLRERKCDEEKWREL